MNHVRKYNFFYISEQLNKDTEKNISHKKHELILFIIGGFFLSEGFCPGGLCPRPMNYVNIVKQCFYMWSTLKLSKDRMKVLTS